MNACCASLAPVPCRPLREGDVVNIDVTAYLNGHHGDTNATFFVGASSASERLLISMCTMILWLYNIAIYMHHVVASAPHSNAHWDGSPLTAGRLIALMYQPPAMACFRSGGVLLSMWWPVSAWLIPRTCMVAFPCRAAFCSSS